MSRIPAHTLDTAPDASRPILAALMSGPGGLGRILNLQAQMAHAPVVLAAYAGMREAIGQYATLEPKTRAAIQLTVSTAESCDYSLAINTMLAGRAGWTESEISDVRSGRYTADAKLAALLAVAHEAAINDGAVENPTWANALEAGWTDAELAEAFICIALTSFVDRFVAYAGTEIDLPAQPARA